MMTNMTPEKNEFNVALLSYDDLPGGERGWRWI
jgi:hypothetical protein